MLPDEVHGYAEPHLDGGATALAVLHAQPSVYATLASGDAAVVEVWEALRGDAEGLIEQLRMLRERHSPAFFAGVRDRDLAPDAAGSLAPVERAARHVYLRNTARPDAAGASPRRSADAVFGREALAIDEAGLRAAARLLSERDVRFQVTAPFELLPALREDDVVWLSAADAQRDADTDADQRVQRELRSLVGSIVARGAGVLAPAHPLLEGVRELGPVLETDGVTLLASAGLRRSHRR
ncbi:hypothetical protein [Herbiconiux liangxiaofengii]|uniref:hypothetical protein n=1 Tax=Herbiconiux liangxiaofengii TaxID=3342795 RepID=UPI0035B7D527